jgi:hypothetical protein
MATLPEFKQRQIARRSTSDIDRLAKQYKASVDAMTGEYQTAFTGYQAGVAEKMKPFEAQMANYKDSLLPTYEAQKTAYQKRLDDYNVLLADLNKNPVIEKQGTRTVMQPVPFIPPIGTGGAGPAGGGGVGGPQFMPVDEQYTYYEKRPIPKFTDKAPLTPAIPVSPDIPAFDSSQFDAQKGQAESTFNREVGERRAAKLGAVSRRGARPLLSGVK